MGLLISTLGLIIPSFEIFFIRLQQLPVIVVLEVIEAFYLLVFIALVADNYLLPSLLNIAKRYSLSRDMTGILVAVGNLIPEIALTVLSMLMHGVKMTEFAIATNVGAATYSVTVVPALAVIINMRAGGDIPSE